MYEWENKPGSVIADPLGCDVWTSERVINGLCDVDFVAPAIVIGNTTNLTCVTLAFPTLRVGTEKPFGAGSILVYVIGPTFIGWTWECKDL